MCCTIPTGDFLLLLLSRVLDLLLLLVEGEDLASAADPLSALAMRPLLSPLFMLGR